MPKYQVVETSQMLVKRTRMIEAENPQDAADRLMNSLDWDDADILDGITLDVEVVNSTGETVLLLGDG